LSLYKHRVIRQQVLRDQQQSVDIRALTQARLRLQQVVSEEFARTRSTRGRKRAARFLEGGDPLPALPASRSAALPPDLPLELDETGWSGDYLLPSTRREHDDDA